MFKLIATASVSSFFFGLFGISWESVDEKIQREFPGVQTVSADVLLRRYEAPGAKLPIIIDVREDGEFLVSHLDDALHLENAESISNVIAERGLSKDTEIIVYCSVGYRSASVAADLQERGFTQVLNLEHSLFEWANKGYPMTSASGSTDKVHPFNKAWSVLVDESLHAYPDK
jgi:rhodanese-related sulfurtransferase